MKLLLYKVNSDISIDHNKPNDICTYFILFINEQCVIGGFYLFSRFPVNFQSNKWRKKKTAWKGMQEGIGNAHTHIHTPRTRQKAWRAVVRGEKHARMPALARQSAALIGLGKGKAYRVIRSHTHRNKHYIIQLQLLIVTGKEPQALVRQAL